MNNRLYDEDKVIMRIIKKSYPRCRLHRDELFQIGWVGYLKAVKNFDPTKCDKMTLTYASKYIRKEINTALNGRPQMDTVEYIDDIHHEDVYESPEKTHKKRELIDLMMQKLDVLSDRERRVIELRYLTDDINTLEEVALDLGLRSRERVRQIQEESIKKLQEAFKDERT